MATFLILGLNDLSLEILHTLVQSGQPNRPSAGCRRPKHWPDSLACLHCATSQEDSASRSAFCFTTVVICPVVIRDAPYILISICKPLYTNPRVTLWKVKLSLPITWHGMHAQFCTQMLRQIDRIAMLAGINGLGVGPKERAGIRIAQAER